MSGDLSFLAALLLGPPALYLGSRWLWRGLSAAGRQQLGRLLHIFACLYLPVLGWLYSEILWGPSFATDGEVAHHLGGLLLSFVIWSGLAALLAPLVLLALNAVRAATRPPS